jgi:hypothetical protein
MKHKCSNCGSLKVQHAMWVTLNEGTVGETFGTFNEQDTSYCPDCGARGSIAVAPPDPIYPDPLAPVRLTVDQLEWLVNHLSERSARIDEGEVATLRAFVGILDAMEAVAAGQLRDDIQFVAGQLRGRIEAESRKPNVCRRDPDDIEECPSCTYLGHTCPVCDPEQHFLFEDAVEGLSVEDPTDWTISCEGTTEDGMSWDFDLFAERKDGHRMRWVVAEDGYRENVHGGEWVDLAREAVPA